MFLNRNVDSCYGFQIKSNNRIKLYQYKKKYYKIDSYQIYLL